MGRKMDKGFRSGIKANTLELMDKHPELTWKQLAERQGLAVSTLRTICSEDGRTIKRKKVVKHEEI